MRIVFMGTPDFAAVTLKALHDADFEILAVVSQPDKPVGRHAELKPTAVKAQALEYGLPVLQPEKASDPEFLQQLKAMAPDVIVVAAYGKLLSKELLDIPRYGCVNVHASILPRWRGAAPIQWAVIEGDREAGVTAMLMNEGLDTGDMLKVKKLTLAADETGGSLFDKLAVLGGELIVETLPELAAGTLKAIPQPQEGVNYAKILTKAMGEIDWTKDAESIERLVRGLYPWPGTFTYTNGKLLKLHKAAVADASGEHLPEECGAVEIADGHIYVNCGTGILELCELQAEGKKRMTAGDFLRGNRLTLLGPKERE